MESVGLLILACALGSFVCARARSASGAVMFALVGLGLLIATPAGAGIPGAVADFLDALNSAATPVLSEPAGGSGAVG
ncbi:hypothetical protein BJF78_17325 [Pseudonocardia sp. CNS-139]|nr:hypothetical protein BJF78_17325 [Pseudonocardia sp. CNS-139]